MLEREKEAKLASILWKDASRAKEAAQLMKITAHELKKLKAINKVLPEPQGGAHQDLEAIP